MIVQFLQCKTSVCEAPNWNMQGSKHLFGSIRNVSTVILVCKYWTLAKLNISIVSCKIVRTYMMFAHNNSYNDFAIANRFMNFVNLSGFAPCQGKNEIVLLTRIRPIAYGTLPGTSATDTPPLLGIGGYYTMYQPVAPSHRYLDPKRVKVFLYPSDDVFCSHQLIVFILPRSMCLVLAHEFSAYPLLIHRYCSYELPSGGKHKRSA